MKCPYCSNKETKVIDTREIDSKNSVRRRRECTECGKRFTTYEEIQNNFWIIKRNGDEEKYDREKLKTGILKACEKRDISEREIDQMIREIENQIKDRFSTPIKTSNIGNIVLEKLKKLDQVAYLRFASVYQDFENISSYEKELKTLKQS
ncbi:MAG: transcriptional regulator NrdR [Candidatus Aenigmatarchaeota archaeon]